MANIPETVAVENKALPHFFNARLMHTATYTDPTEIICEYAKAIELDPGLFEAYNNLAALTIDQCKDREHPYLLTNCISSLETGCVLEAGIPSLQPSYLLDQVIQIRPNWALAQYNLAVLDWNTLANGNDAAHMIQDTKDAFQGVLESDSTIAGAHIMLGNLAIWEEDFELAVQYFSTAADLWPDSPEVRVNLGQALALAERDEEAITAYRQALTLTLDDTEVSKETHLALGNLYHRQGNLDRAIQEYQSIQLPVSPDFDCTLSLALTKHKIDTGAGVNAIQQIETSPCTHWILPELLPLPRYLLWLIRSIQGSPAAESFSWNTDINALNLYSSDFTAWTSGDVAWMTWIDISRECVTSDSNDISLWGSEVNSCLPNSLEERLEAVYAKFQQRVHHRIFFNQEAYPGVGACPHVFTYDDQHQDWLPDTTIIYKLIGPEAEQRQARPLTRFDGRLWLRELEPETSYVDQLYVRVLTADGRWFTLTPSDPALIADDGDYLILQQGGERMLEFEFPPGALPVRQAWAVADGYYVPYDARE
jgi:tetratricopeptide (TPR) repeat protein